MSRKTFHGKVGVKFKAGYTASKRKSMLRNVVTDLIVNGRVQVTLATAKDLVDLADEMVSKTTDAGSVPSTLFTIATPARSAQIPS